MSGGHFGYKQHAVSDIAEDVQRLIDSNGEEDGYNFPSYVVDEFKQGVKALRRAAVYAQRIDWLVSGDDGEDSFIKRLFEELNEQPR